MSTLSQENCCPNGDCSTTPDSCPVRCARVFVPFYEACHTFLDATKMGEFTGFLPLCVRNSSSTA